MSDKNIYQRINAVMAECDYLQKESAGMGKGVKYDDVIAMLRPLMIKHRIVMRVTQLDFCHLEGLGAGKQNLFQGFYQLDLINIDKTDQIMTQTASGQGMDTGDKAPGKAQTYAVKIMLTKGFALETGEDEESRAEKMEAQGAIISGDQYAELEELLGAEGNDKFKRDNLHRRILGSYKIGNIRNLPACKFKEVIEGLKKCK